MKSEPGVTGGSKASGPLAVLVCGGRDYSDRPHAYRTLTHIKRSRGISKIITGGAQGADKLGAEWALDNFIKLSTFPADWNTFGRKAGHIRNGQMLQFGKPDLVVVFPGGAGTANMVEQATRAGVEIFYACKPRVDKQAT